MRHESVIEDEAERMVADNQRDSSANYHTDYDSGDSHSSLDLFRESPARYAAIRVFRTMRPDPPTASMKVGQALHALFLEYDKGSRIVVRDRRRPPTGPTIWNTTAALGREKYQLSEKEYGTLSGMWLALCNEPDAWNLLVAQTGMNEHVFKGFVEILLLHVKCKPDRLLYNGLVVDLKTVDGAVDPESWSRTLLRWGYHRQAAFYLDVLELAGQKADKFVFVAVSKDPPHDIGIYLIPDDDVEDGRRENREALEDLAQCRRTGVWKHEWQGKILTVGRPRWAKDR